MTLQLKFQHSHRPSNHEFRDCKQPVNEIPFDPLVNFRFFLIGVGWGGLGWALIRGRVLN